MEWRVAWGRLRSMFATCLAPDPSRPSRLPAPARYSFSQRLLNRHRADHPKIQGTNAGFDDCAVPNDDYEESLGLDVSGCRLEHGLGGDRLQVLDVVGVIGLRQAVDQQLLELRGEVTNRFELAGESESEVVLRLAKFVGANGFADPVQLVEELAQRLRCLVGLHASGREHRTRKEAHVETRSGTVRIP